MKHQKDMTIEIECGDTTCTKYPRIRCRFLANEAYVGCVCTLFTEQKKIDGHWVERHRELDDLGGIKRLTECMGTFK